MSSSKEHWEHVYESKAPDAVSWYRPHLETSVALIGRICPGHDCAVIDVGGGHSTLVDDLVAGGYRDLTVLDLSGHALAQARRRLGAPGNAVAWLTGDVTTLELPAARYDVWHDRAVFHFLTAPEDRSRYVAQVAKAVRPGGYVIVATFGPQGPEKCSGLDVQRYDAESLHGQFGARYQLVDSRTEMHETPFGTVQQFVYCLCRVRAA